MATRRSLAGGAVAALLGTTGAGAAELVADKLHPDAELIACAEFRACDRAQRAIYDGPNAIANDDAASTAASPIHAHMHALVEAMGDVRAGTASGIQARAEALAQHSGEWSFSFDERETMTGRLLGYLMRDAAALSRLD